ncbi:hypothetical protein [Roseobacter weihaiensis]|uniref:hypothetical protein n=1 Tax=Roseobacter weihaiensis TaxID=2763262 RepID=UPI001D09F5D6|nr:hypothetical protein [Roseobacter sp. H9]
MPAFAPLLYPPTWVAIGEAAKWTLITLGVVGAGAATGVAINEMTQDEGETEAAPSADTRSCANCGERRRCAPCVPPAGTRRFIRLDRVPPGRSHYPCPGDHVHIQIRHQNPTTCECYWNTPSSPHDVICIEQGGDAPADLYYP